MEEKAPPPSQLGNLEAFLSSSTAIASAAPSALSVTQFRAPINSGFALLQSCPSGARDAFLQLVAILADVATGAHLRTPARGDKREAATLIETAVSTHLAPLAERHPAYWASHVAQWALAVLGDLSAKYSSRLTPRGSSAKGMQLHEALPAWLSCPPTSALIALATKCLEAVEATEDDAAAARATETCVSLLLDLSVRHGSQFDWVVAHIGSAFPETIITRVLAVGLKELCGYAESQVKRDKSFNIARVPKFESVVGILDHLAATHRAQISEAVRAMVIDSVGGGAGDEECEAAASEGKKKKEAEKEKDPTAQQVATVPYLLFLAQRSDSFRATVADDVYDTVNLDMADRIMDLIDVWEERFFPKGGGGGGGGAEGPLVELCVQLVTSLGGSGGKDLIRLLLDLSGDSNREVAKDVRAGCRLVLDLVLAEIQSSVHSPAAKDAAAAGSANEPKIISAISSHADYFMENYLLVKDSYHRRCAVNMLSYLSLHRSAGGRSLAVKVIKYCLLHAEAEEELGVMFEFIKDTELWVTGIVAAAVTQSVRANVTVARQAVLLDNLGTVLQFQSFAPVTSADADHKLKLVSQFSRPVAGCQAELLAKLCHRPLVPKVLKILHFVPLLPSSPGEQPPQLSVSLLHAAAQCVVHTVFQQLEAATEDAHAQRSGTGKKESEPDDEDDEENVALIMAQCAKILLDVANAHPAGMPMILRFLVEGAINSKFAALFGGKFRDGATEKRPPMSRTTSLLEENYKYGSMPTHPLGAAVAFHAGTIGEGKRRPERALPYSSDAVDFNQFTFVTLLFKICHSSTRAASSPPVPASASAEQKAHQEQQQLSDASKEASKQLALLLVEVVSPDVMYNGLPWPDDDFIKVTIERDLVISKRFEEHPVLWKVLAGLAEARPALCYCSVLLRALMAVQMNHWQASVANRASDNPKQLETTRRVLELMSVGQYLPHPLDSVSDVLGQLHAFHVHCVLVDVWNYMRDNVPSPVAFSATAAGMAGKGTAKAGYRMFREFESYKNYKQYCERLRLIMIQHLPRLSAEFKRFFVDVATAEMQQGEKGLKLAMEY